MSQENGKSVEASPLTLLTDSDNIEVGSDDRPSIPSLSARNVIEDSSIDSLKNGITDMPVTETSAENMDAANVSVVPKSSTSGSGQDVSRENHLSAEIKQEKDSEYQQLNGTQKVENNCDKSETCVEETESISSHLAASVQEIEECSSNLDEAKNDEWMDILGNGQLKKKVLNQGRENSRPTQGSLVTVKVQSFLENGICFQDNTETFILGDGDTLSAIDLTVALMNFGEKAEVTSSSRFAYGKHGREPDIPADADVHFTLELLDVQPGPDVDKLPTIERLAYGEKKRERGNELFGRKDFSGAINSYSKAIKFVDAGGGGLDGEASVLQQMLDCKLKCYNNMAASQLKIGAIEAAMRSLHEVLGVQPDNIKALYRLGKVYSSKGQTEQAVAILKKALKLDPESKLLHRELSWLTKQQQREAETEKSLYKRMMGDISVTAKKPNKKQGGGVLKWTLLAGGAIAAAASVLFAYYKYGH
ncbi:hypothetical protein C0Q70_20661 [Pomacea canaliculata]|uniref:peptidylprolyl isomerase n=2 Tax=Pomacea canaliculata TaxID=400727 RepID=A0A2T7NG62_POMCA|nr:peptidyl-prolyl cis-trans isomerase FKBP8-like isoform X3 [Pomacea canaliculata]PVD20167.1 hypothetical protein C0Q70_20661 [Pomacea canaliculata]